MLDFAERCTRRRRAHARLDVPTPRNVYVKSEEKKDFRVSSSVIKTVSIREKIKFPTVFIQNQPFLGLREPEMLLKSPNFLQSPHLNVVYILRGVGTTHLTARSSPWQSIPMESTTVSPKV